MARLCWLLFLCDDLSSFLLGGVGRIRVARLFAEGTFLFG